MNNKVKLDDSILALSLDFQHACAIATCLLLTEDKIQHDELVSKFDDFSRLVSQMRGLNLRLAQLSAASSPSKEEIDIDIVKDVISTHSYLDDELWDLVKDFSCQWGATNQYDEAFMDGSFGLSNMLKRINDELSAIIYIDLKKAA
ncbi:hypothetical protein Q4602_08400 [Paraglaciecola chathamensis]|uniref:hypothetical protein n=1 Tax=Paraglaciecola chathamensis TaxID=368405 RepID=UPI00270077E5|nr:hypothetical protein [Paraglaciecola chathamensis]MDO6839483.1 hypothetical protein [Paraglaciecola chathamensis]